MFGDKVSFSIVAHDLASKDFRQVGDAAMAMAVKVRTANKLADGSTVTTTRTYKQLFEEVRHGEQDMDRFGSSIWRSANRVKLANDLLDKSFWRSGGQATVWLKIILAGLPLIPPLIVAITVALAALNSLLFSMLPGIALLGAAFAANWSWIKGKSKEMDTLTHAWTAFSKAVRPDVLRIFDAALRPITYLLQQAQPIVHAFADVLIGFLDDLNSEVRGAGFKDFLTWVKEVGAVNFGHMLKGMENLVVGLANLGMAFTGQGQGLAAWFDGITQKFRDWSAELGKSDGFRKFMEYFQATWPKVSELIGNLTTAIAHIILAFAPLAPAALDVLNAIIGAFNRIPISVLTDLIVGIGALKGALYLLGGALAAINAALAITPLGATIVALAALTAGLIYAYRHSRTFREVVSAVLDAVGQAWSEFRYIVQPIVDWFVADIWPHLREQMILFGKAAAAAAVLLAESFRNAWNVLVPVFQFLLKGMANVMEGWGRMLNTMAKVPGWGWVKDLGDGMIASAESARRLAGAIRSIPKYWESTVRTNFVETHTVHTVNVGVRQGQEIQARATGGRARARHPYWVGEEGPELFIPDNSGTVVPTDKSREMVAGPGGGGMSERELAKVVAREVARALSNITIRLDDGDGNGRRAYLLSGGF